MDNSQILENAVLTLPPDEVSALYKRLGQVVNTARALGLACRFCGLEHVKVLVENGATFKYVRPENPNVCFKVYFWSGLLEMTRAMRCAYFINSDWSVSDGSENVKEPKVIPIEQRVEIVRYLYENRERVLFDAGELLFYSIMSSTKEITAVLKELGAALSEERITALTESGRSFEWQEYCRMTGRLSDEEFFEVMRGLIAEVGGKKLYYTDSLFWENYNPYRKQFRFFKPEFFGFFLDNFDHKNMNKTQLMKGAVNQNSPKCLEKCAEQGWLKVPRKRDEMIQYSTEKGMTECTAFLLDFKNRTADLAAERIKAEKKMLAELNANPNSVSELKKIWSYEKQEDGTLKITSYKGKRPEAKVPAVIGKNTVTAIGDQAFSSGVSRIRDEQRDFRKTELVKITLPDTVKSIGECAFSGCWNLCEVNIPDGVVEIGRLAFGGCRKVTELKLPDSVRKIGDGAFAGCWNLCEVNIPDGVVEIGRRAFSECRKVTELKLPDSVRSIGEGAFADCETITGIRVPEGVTEIGDYTFSGCRSLKSVSLPGTVVNIGKLAFHGCSSLEEIVIPEGVAEIGSLVFGQCSALKTVVLPASVKKIKNYKYRDQPPVHILQEQENVTVIVEPKSYAEKYCKRNGINYKYK